MAAGKGDVAVLKVIQQFAPERLKEKDSSEETPLHVAAGAH